jgi:DNA-binding MarR family transcriptional regulator
MKGTGVDTEAMTRLRHVITRLSRQLNATATSAGLTPSQASVLGLIAGRGPLGLPELAELEGINPTMLSRVIGKLDDAGLITRSADPSDLRSVIVQAAPAGQALHKRIKAQRAAAVSACFARLSQEQGDTIIAALPALEALVEELQRPPK